MYTNDPEFYNIVKKIVNHLSEEDLEALKNSIEGYNLMPTESINLLFTGSSLCGKSTTIEMLEKEALKNTGIQLPGSFSPKINNTPFPSSSITENGEECSIITSYHDIAAITCWETPGMGLCQESDSIIINQTKDKLNEFNRQVNNKPIIDMAIIIHDFSFDDWRNTYNICEELASSNRVLLAVNKKNNPASSKDISYEIPYALRNRCKEHNIEIVCYDSHDEPSVRYLLFYIILLIKSRNIEAPLIVIKDEIRPVLLLDNGCSINSTSFTYRLRAWGELLGLPSVIKNVCDVLDKYDKANSIVNDVTAIALNPSLTGKAAPIVHLVITLMQILQDEDALL